MSFRLSVPNSLHTCTLVHLWVSLLITVYYKKRLLWWGLSDTFISGIMTPILLTNWNFSPCGSLSVFLASMKLHYVLKESRFARCHHCSLEGLSKSFPLEPCDPNHFRGLWMLHVTCTSWDRSSFVCSHCSHRRIVVRDSSRYSFHFLSFSSKISASLALPLSYSIVREKRMNPRLLTQMNPFKVYFKGFI